MTASHLSGFLELENGQLIMPPVTAGRATTGTVKVDYGPLAERPPARVAVARVHGHRTGIAYTRHLDPPVLLEAGDTLSIEYGFWDLDRSTMNDEKFPGQTTALCGEAGYGRLCALPPGHDGRHGWETAPATGRELLNAYLQRTGLARPADAGQQYQVQLLAQWVDHLDDVLAAEQLPSGDRLPAETRQRILRQMIYGGTPTGAEAGLRAELAAGLQSVLERTAVPRING